MADILRHRARIIGDDAIPGKRKVIAIVLERDAVLRISRPPDSVAKLPDLSRGVGQIIHTTWVA